MPMFKDIKKRPLKTRGGETPPPYTPPAPAPEPVVKTTRVRILRRIISRNYGSFVPGQVAHLPVILARDWVDMKMAEYDKSLDGPSESK
jgi:hypothetical protein